MIWPPGMVTDSVRRIQCASGCLRSSTKRRAKALGDSARARSRSSRKSSHSLRSSSRIRMPAALRGRQAHEPRRRLSLETVVTLLFLERTAREHGAHYTDGTCGAKGAAQSRGKHEYRGRLVTGAFAES